MTNSLRTWKWPSRNSWFSHESHGDLPIVFCMFTRPGNWFFTETWWLMMKFMDALLWWMNGMITSKRDITGEIGLLDSRKKWPYDNILIFRLVKYLKCSQFFSYRVPPGSLTPQGFPLWDIDDRRCFWRKDPGKDPTYWNETHGQFTDFCWLKSIFYLVLPIFPPFLIYDSILRKNNNLTISINLHQFPHLSTCRFLTNLPIIYW